MVTTNAQQTPALRNRNLTCSTRPRGATGQPWLGAHRSPGSPRVPPAASWGSAAPGMGRSSGRRAADVPNSSSVNLGSCPACCCQALPELPRAGCSSRQYPGSSAELPAGSRAQDTSFGGELQGELRTRLYLQHNLTTLLVMAAPVIALALKPRAGEQLFPTFCGVGRQPQVLAGLSGGWFKFPL